MTCGLNLSNNRQSYIHLNHKNICMKKIIFASMAALIFSVSAMAQTSGTATDKKSDMKDLRKDMRDVRKDKMARKKELKEGDKAEAKNLTADIRSDKKNIKSDAKDLKADGVKHPVKRAANQIRRHH
jgi:uncharacterized protein YlxW (UPF0749 family)